MTPRSSAVLAALLLAACPAPAPAPKAPTPPPAVAGHAPAPATPAPDLFARYRQWNRLANARDWAGLRAQMTDDVTLRPASSNMVLHGPDNLIEFYKSFAVGFGDLTTEPILILTRPGHLVALALTRGTNDTAIGSQAPTGKRTSFLGLTTFDYDAKGQITQVVAYADNLNFMGQLGLWSGKTRPVDESQVDGPEIVHAGADPDHAPAVALMKQFADHINAHDAPGLLALYAPDAVLDDTHLAAPIATPGAIARHFSDFFVAFPDVSIDDLHSWGAGDYGVATFKLRGTNGGTYRRLGASETMRQIDLEVAMLVHIRGDVITQQQLFVDGTAMGMQLGVLSTPGDEPPPPPSK